MCCRETSGWLALNTDSKFWEVELRSFPTGMQGALAIPTIWPCIPVPMTVPKTSTVIPALEMAMMRLCMEQKANALITVYIILSCDWSEGGVYLSVTAADSSLYLCAQSNSTCLPSFNNYYCVNPFK